MRSIRLRSAGIADDVVVIHVRNVYRPTRHAYVSFIDTTIAVSAAGWDRWDQAGPALLAFERSYYESAALICVAAEAARTSVLDTYRQASAKVVTVGGGTNFVPQPELVEERRQRTRRSALTILFVGREFERKGGDLLLGAVRLLQSEGFSIRLLLVGCDVAAEGPGIEVLGPVFDRDELWRLYREADIFCHPARWEPYGLVVQEAMAAGLPVVVSRTGELPSIVADAGVVVEEPGAAGVAAVLRPLLTDDDLRSALGRAAVERVAGHLSWDGVAARMVAGIRSAAPDRLVRR